MSKNILLTMNIRKHHTIEDCIEHEYIDYFLRLGFNPILLTSKVDFRYYFDNIDIDGVILTGGIDVGASDELSQIRDFSEAKVLEYCIKNRLPVLGICRGMHMINTFFGGNVTRNISNHVRKNHIVRNSASSFTNIACSELLVNSYHKHGVYIHDLASSLEIAFQDTNDNVIEGLYHSEYPIFAIQWHPEREKIPNQVIDKLIVDFLRSQLL